MRIKKGLLLIGFMALIMLTGCGERKELTEFKENMTSFYTEITSIGESMNAISPDSEDAVSSLLGYLDAMNLQFQFLAEIQVPAEFVSIEALADDAADHMSQAVSYYRQAYEGESFDENLAEAASQHYESAMKRVNYIATLLQGDIPEDANVIVTEGEDTEFTPYSEENENDGQE
ncbi:MAG: hypothetical protein IJP31_12305 [Lachnospiraceae bacterium]|nr:hypothetical protein [Lachnospiraceae bacterium]